MRVEVVRVTPQVAVEWLAKPWARQRTLSGPVVAKYARVMEEKRWVEPTLDPIGFTAEGLLANGQHRLSAVIKAGWEGDMLVAYDVPDETFLVHDTGRRRLASQFIRLGHAKTIAAIARLVMWYDTAHPALPRGPGATFDNDEILAFVDAHEKDLFEVTLDAELVHRKTGIPASVHGAVLFIARRGDMDGELLASWIEGLSTGADLGNQDPRLLLRERISKNPVVKRDQVMLWYLITRAFNAYMHGRTLGKLVGDTSDPPPVVRITPYQRKVNSTPGPKEA